MIRVTRDASNRPRGFQRRAKTLSKAFHEARRLDPSLSAAGFWAKVRHDLGEDVDALATVFRGKCAFCESRMAHVSRPHVEHYRPKGRQEFEDRMFDWENWLLSCGRCNESKWMHFPICAGEVPCLIDPTSDEPAEHLGFVNEFISGLTTRGDETVRILGLTRGPLEGERARWLMTIDLLLLLAVGPPPLREARDLLVWCTCVEAPWTACTRSYLQERAPKQLRAAPTAIQGEPVARIRELTHAQRGRTSLLE